jgi:hypothetical protein
MNTDYPSLLKLVPGQYIKEATRYGLDLSDKLDAESWSKLVSGLVKMAGKMSGGRDTLTAWLGDVLAYGKNKYRGQIAEYAKAAGLSPGTLRDAKLVCSRIPVSCRHDTLSWSHHVEIGRAFSAIDEIERWLRIALDEGLSKNELRLRIRESLAESKLSGQKNSKVDAAVEPFALLRELRAVGRQVEFQTAVWNRWPPDTCRLALSESTSLVKFIEQLRARSALPAAS